MVYVGKSKRLRTRLLSYFRAAFPEEKAARIVREAATIEWDYVPSEFAALLAEMRAIKRFRPRLNVAMKRDARHFAFIKLTGARRRSCSRCAAPAATTARCTTAPSTGRAASRNRCAS